MMKSLGSIGLCLSVLFGCLLLALVAEVYYLLCWKKRLASKDIEHNYSNPAKEFCWKHPTSVSHTALAPEEVCSTLNKDNNFGEDGSEIELLGLQHLAGPPRFLCTIIEETKEDLESLDGKCKADIKSAKGSISLHDFLLEVDTPYLTPTASPQIFSPMSSTISCSPHRFNPLFESRTDAEFNRIRSSPPPKFKFLQDAEEKLRRKLREEIKHVKDDEECSFITITVDESRDKEVSHRHHLPHCNSSTLQVLHLSS